MNRALWKPNNKGIDLRRFKWQVCFYLPFRELYEVIVPFLKYNIEYGEEWVMKRNMKTNRYAIFTKGEKVKQSIALQALVDQKKLNKEGRGWGATEQVIKRKPNNPKKEEE